MPPITKGKQLERVVRFPQPLYNDLKKLAISENRSVQGQILNAIEEQLARRKS